MTISSPIESLVEQEHVFLQNVSWEFYEQVLAEVGDRPIRVTFDNGSMEIVSPLSLHERWKKRIGQMIEKICFAQNISVDPVGSTTFRRKDRRKGLEPDECYYIQNARAVGGKERLDLPRDPPPDLAVEIDITRRSIAREPIYAGLGVPELWRFDGKNLVVLLLGADGKYQPSTASLAFPFLPMDQFNRFLKQFERDDHSVVVRAFWEWINTLG